LNPSEQFPTPGELLKFADAITSSGVSLEEESLLTTMSLLSTEERRLFLDLLSRFHVCRFEQYLAKGALLAQAIVELLAASEKKVVMLPLVNPTSQRKPKSGEAITWVMSREMRSSVKVSGRSFDIASRDISRFLKGKEKTAFVMVDDFIGTGKTAKESIDWLTSLGVRSSEIYVGCFAGLSEGRDKISDAGVKSVFLSSLSKGISGADHIIDKSGALELMGGIEKRNGVTDEYRFGYEGSEALALMCFCPNNTFPIFWWDGPKWSGAFQR